VELELGVCVWYHFFFLFRCGICNESGRSSSVGIIVSGQVIRDDNCVR
jgi:hypothetical protein